MMITTAYHKAIINAPLDSVWTTIKTFDRVERYLSVVSNSQVKEENNITKRVCNVQLNSNQKATLVERLDFVDDLRHSLGYTIIEAPEPFKDAVGTISLSETSDHECQIEFLGKFIGDNNKQAKSMAENIYSMMADGLKRLHESN